MGLTYVRATADQAVAELKIPEQYLKADGTVDEALYSGLVEAAASVGAALHAMLWKLPVVGVENQTSFHRPARSARLRVTATPLVRDQHTQLFSLVVQPPRVDPPTA
jgi:acyl-coenzyme A thioesterase PaaI-like protein